MTQNAKNKARVKIMEYLANPSNKFVARSTLAKDICNYKKSQSLYQIFTVIELDQIEKEALEIRRKNCQRQSAAVDQALFKKAIAGDVAAIKLWYQRFEGWSEKTQHEFPDENGKPQKIGETKILNITEARLKEIIKDLNEKV